MKRTSIATLTLLLAAAVAYGATAITVNPSEMKNGEKKSLVDGTKTITVSRDGDDVNIKIEGGGSTRTLTISRSGDELRVSRDGRNEVFVMPNLPKIMIHGDAIRPRPFRWNNEAQTWYVCPKDHTMLRVPDTKDDHTFKCPVDGTTMEKRKTHGFQFFFDDDDDSHVESL